MKIMIDLDGVLSSFNSGLLRVCNNLWPGRVPFDYVPHTWDFYPEIGLSVAEWKKLWETIKKTENFWYDLDAYPDNMLALNEFMARRKDYDIFFITSRLQTAGNTVSKQSIEWLKKNFWPGHKAGWSVIPVAGHGPKAPAVKADMVRATGIEASIDDFQPTAEMLSTVENHYAFLLNQPWNENLPTNAKRVNSLDEFLKSISEPIIYERVV